MWALLHLLSCTVQGDATTPDFVPPDETGRPCDVEICDGLDNDCDGAIDEDATDAVLWFEDTDGDGYGAGQGIAACEAPTDHVAADGDCNDDDGSIHPGAKEPCGGEVDRNCDGSLPSQDADVDGFQSCEECDDGNDTVFPGADEVCDELDNDCNGEVDDDPIDGQTFFADDDGDGFGDAASPVIACEAPKGTVADDTDCDDASPERFPGNPEVCDGLDNDCNGDLPDDEADLDGDGFDVCADQDCDDDNGDVGPGPDTDSDGDHDCFDTDDDDDGLSDVDEQLGTGGFVTDPLLADTDGDGVDDATDPAPVTPECANTLYLWDDFTTDPFAGDWESYSGTWEWDKATEVSSTDDGDWGLLWQPKLDVADARFEIEISPKDRYPAGFMFRVASLGSWAWQAEAYSVQLYPDQNEVWLIHYANAIEVVAEASIPTATSYLLEVEVSGSDIDVWVDGSLLISETHSDGPTSGALGLRTYYTLASYDSILVCD